MEIKKKCINFKKNAKELGYDLKLTHVQELIAKYEGFKNRHAMFKAQEESRDKQVLNTPKWYYYELHVFFGRDEGYTTGFRSKEDFKVGNSMLDETAILLQAEEYAIFQDEGDSRYVDQIEQVEEKDWKWLLDDGQNKDCKSCEQLFIPSNMHDDDICKNCYKKLVKIYIYR